MVVLSSSVEAQARFVTNLQRLLTEGEFVSTYKFALLVSLARWAVEHPDYDESVPLDVAALAPHFVELYWPHVMPFVDASDGEALKVAEAVDSGLGFGAEWSNVLVQDRGQRSEHQVPRVLKRIREAFEECQGPWVRLGAEPRERLLREVRRSIAEMPLWKLHTVRSGREPMRFLYRRGGSKFELVFEPGIVACLVHFAPLVEELARSAWVRHVLRCNPRLLGASARVESFLFPESRASLAAWEAPLRAVQGEACFYCGRSMRGRPDVDHFIPWSRYRRDLGHNLVLAHSDCNNAKRDLLASLTHLARWCTRNARDGEAMGVSFDELGLPHDRQVSRQVARSFYQLAEVEGAELWERGSILVPLDSGWRSLLGVN